MAREIVANADGLAELAEQINAEHAKCIDGARTTLLRAVALGGRLAEAKAQCGHGAWETWLAANIAFSPSQARRYMQLHANGKQIDIDEATIGERIATLAKPKRAPVRVIETAHGYSESESGDADAPPDDDGPLPSAGDSVDVVCDGLGDPVTDPDLIAVFVDTTLHDLQLDIRRIKRELKKAAETPAAIFLHLQSVESALKQAAAEVGFALPFAQLPDGARGQDKTWDAAGWLPKPIYDRLPKEQK